MALSITPVILAGGTGSRLWPISHRELPKQFIDLTHDGASTFQAALGRTSGALFARPIVITSRECHAIALQQMQSLGICGDIIVEPEQCGTAFAVAVAAHAVLGRHDGSLCLVLASDHIVKGAEHFDADCAIAAQLAAAGHIVVFGVKPEHPSADYGYIKPRAALLEGRASIVKRFVEKPTADVASRLIEEGHLWNSGNLLFDPAAMIAELAAIAPDVASAGSAAFSRAMLHNGSLILPQDCDPMLDGISIDHAFLEKTTRAVVVRASFSWADIGSWQSVYDIGDKDAQGNVLKGQVHAIDTSDSLIYSDGPIATVIGLRDIAVVASGDAVLVADRRQASSVKQHVHRFRDAQSREAVEQHRIHRPWGWYEQLGAGCNFRVKQLCVKPGAALSLQMHRHRAEHWTIAQGTARITIANRTDVFNEGSDVYIPKKCIHRLSNPADAELIVIEVQTGSYLGEDDIVRFEDLYDRA